MDSSIGHRPEARKIADHTRKSRTAAMTGAAAAVTEKGSEKGQSPVIAFSNRDI